MVSILGTLFKYKEKESPDELGLFPQQVHVDAFPERRYLWTSRFFVITTCLSICFNMLLGSVIYAMLPCFGVEPRLYRINDNTNQVEILEEYEREYYASDLIAEQYLREYIILRYTISDDYAEMKDRWRKNSKFFWYQTQEVFSDFERNDAETVYNQFKKIGLQRYVEVVWTKHVSRSMWLVEFKTYDTTNDNPEPKIDVWRATVRIGYANGLKFRKPEDRILNPYGFLVYSFTLSYLGDEDNGPNEVPSHLKYNMMMM